MTKTKKKEKSPSATGTYVYDKKLGRVVQISDQVPKVASKGGAASAEPGPCGRSVCGRGRCAGGAD